MPKNKLARLAINILFIVAWCFVFMYICGPSFWGNNIWNNFVTSISINGIIVMPFFILWIPIFFITRYIWFKESRNRIFYGLFDNFKKYQPRIYSTSSNADELKKYAELKDQGIITEEEFQAKKKQILGL